MAAMGQGVSDERYRRQQSVAGVGPAGQALIAAGVVVVEGRGLDAEVAALYLAGAGVGTLCVDPVLLPACRALNSSITIEAQAQPEVLRVVLGARAYRPEQGDPVARGSSAARWVLARLLSPEARP